MRFFVVSCLLVLLSLLRPCPVVAGVAERYGVVADTAGNAAALQARLDSMLRSHPMLQGGAVDTAISPVHVFEDQTVAFYLLLLLFVMLGLIRLSNPRYFQSVFRAFWNPTTNMRHNRDPLSNAELPNLLMNVFYAMSLGAYIFYVVQAFAGPRSGVLPPALLLTLLILGVLVLYAGKYLMIRFSGWAFRVETVTDQYLFNVFLMNKIIGIVLLPFVVLLAFAGEAWAGPVVVVSVLVIGLLVINRYVRSWQVFGSFFQFSKFHFFTYLCASELLPLAVLMKLLVRGLTYY